jgi:hypothetical protein
MRSRKRRAQAINVQQQQGSNGLLKRHEPWLWRGQPAYDLSLIFSPVLEAVLSHFSCLVRAAILQEGKV